MGQNGAPPRWLRGMMSLSLWTMDCWGIRESGTEWSPHVGVHFQAVLGRKQGISRALEPAFTHRFCYGDTFYNQGMTATLVVKEATPQLPVPATLLAPQLLSDGNFQCLVSNLVAGTTYIMQASTNLVDWTSISTNIVFRSVETFTDNNAAASGIRFYRSWHQP